MAEGLQASLETEVMQLLLAGQHPVLEILRAQFKCSRVKKREMTGAGFYLSFETDSALKATDISQITLGDVHAQIEGLKNGAGFVLFIVDGLVGCLEGYSYDEPWPNEIKKYSLTYSHGTKRRLPDLDLD